MTALEGGRGVVAGASVGPVAAASRSAVEGSAMASASMSDRVVPAMLAVDASGMSIWACSWLDAPAGGNGHKVNKTQYGHMS
jgi:fermentation-respiration switch protein FrsA (DUF1100 family)